MACRISGSFNIILLCLLCQRLLAFLDSHTESENNVNIKFKWSGPIENSDESALSQDADYTFTMTTVDKEKYKCILPKLDQKDEQEIFRNYEGPSPYDLLKPIFSKNLCTYRIEPFWSYELCHGHYLLQFHPEPNTNKLQHEYYLGRIELQSEAEQEALTKENQTQIFSDLPKVRLGDKDYTYYSMNMTDGTFCKVNGKKRFSRILYVCHKDGDNRIYSLKETVSCEYEVIVRSTLLCDHPAFREKTAEEHYIYCYSYPDSPRKPKRLRSMFGPRKVPGEGTREKFSAFPGTATETRLPVDDSKVSKESTDKEAKEPIKPAVSKPATKSYPNDPKLVEDFLNGDHCLRGGARDSWWKYEFCYGKRVQQFHQETGGSKTTILLGVWNADKHSEWIEKHPEHKIIPHKVPKQLIHLYSNGQFCDEKKTERQVAVKLRCKELSTHISTNYVEMFLTEPQTCTYELTVASPLICPLFDKVDEKGVTSGLYK